ncbi:MAG: hypothetical protein AAFV53_35020, partial [Myxococcota bacterium]
EAYLELERHSEGRHEFLNNVIVAMSGGTLEHSALCSAVDALLFMQLRASQRVPGVHLRSRSC